MRHLSLALALVLAGCAAPGEAIDQARKSALYNERIANAGGATAHDVAYANAYAWWIQHYALTGEDPPGWVIEEARSRGAWPEHE